MPVTARAGGAVSPRSPTNVTLCPAGPFDAAPGRGAMVSGSTVFHSSQVSHLPAHLGVTAPQAWQTKRVVALAKGDFSTRFTRGV